VSESRWSALTVTVDAADRPRLDALLADWGMLGLIEAEAADSATERITAHFSSDALPAATLESLSRRALTSPPFTGAVQWRVDPVAERDWTAPAREFFSGIAVGERLSVLPPWASTDHPLAGASVSLRIDPGMAFGTGSHESTRLALEWLVELLGPGQSVLDLGAGSAILSIAAARLGAGRVVAIEIDPEAEENARCNLALNGVSNRVEYRVADFTDAVLDPADLVVCNTLVEIFEPHLARLRDLILSGGHLVLAGFLQIDEAALTEGLRAVGCDEIGLRREGEWSSACVSRR
jgi:ribosomal protein L11 methyltransferase